MRRARCARLFVVGVRRGVTALLTVTVLAVSLSGQVLARNPNGSKAPPDNYIPPRTPTQAAFERMKLGLVASIRARSAATAVSAKVGDNVASTNAVCDNVCDGSGGSGGDGTGGGTGGGTGPATPPMMIVLEARARHQSEVFWCGPASGQVVINYSRGYVYSNLNGDNTTTNWRPQATIATWMKTNESLGTLGGNLAAALNRSDAVLKPFADWSYLYATNSDGADMHAKVVTDVWRYAMPLVIAVKPHKTDAAYWLPSWPREAPGAKHWVTIYGYDGMWDGTDGPNVYYTESAGNGAMGPGPYVTDSLTMWKVNQYNASTIVW